MRRIFLGLFLTLSVSTAAAALKVGDTAPDWMLQGSDQQMHKLSELRGKHVVLAFFPKAFTRSCTLECKSLRDSDRAIRFYDVSYFMLSVDPLEDNTKFAENNGATFPVLADPTKEITRAYGALGWMGMAKRWTFYIDPDGTIVQIDKNVKPKTAGIDLAVSLGELGVPAAEASGQEAAAGR